MKKSLYSLFKNQKELSQAKTLHNLLSLLNKTDLIKTFYRERQFHDEPKFWYYNATLNDTFLPNNGTPFLSSASGFSFFSKNTAIMKCLAESVERYCNYYFNNSFVTQHATILTAQNIIPINTFARYSTNQLSDRAYRHFVFNPNQKIHWTDCINIQSNKTMAIPCNFIYLSAPFISNEPLLYPPISTGVAGGSSILAAIVRGLYEIIERDAYTIAYLRKLSCPAVQIDKIKNKKIQFLIKLANRYNMTIHCIDLTTNIKIPVIGAIIVDKSGIGKAISIGLKSDICVIDAIIGSISEAFHTRGWIRKLAEDTKSKQTDTSINSALSDFATRGLWWNSTTKIDNLYFWLQTKTVSTLNISETKPSLLDEFNYIVKQLTSNGCDIYWKDLTLPIFKHASYYVVKVIVPQAQPLVFDTLKPVLGKRLQLIPKFLKLKPSHTINTDPHPFL